MTSRRKWRRASEAAISDARKIAISVEFRTGFLLLLESRGTLSVLLKAEPLLASPRQNKTRIESRFMKRTSSSRQFALALAISMALSLMAWAQTGGGLASGAKGSEGVVKAQGYISTDGVRPGGKFKIAVAL